MRRENRQHHIGTAAVLLVSGIFAVCIFLVLITGAESYRRLTKRDVESFDRRTAVQYVATKVRQSDATLPSGQRNIFVGGFDGTVWTEKRDGIPVDSGDTLFLEETIDGVSYHTRIYFYDGYIRELFTEASQKVAPEDGEKILTAQGLAFTLKRGTLDVTATNESGAVTELTLSLRSGGEAAS